ncbi:hypothetical protein, partial [Cryobacterium sp. 5B3]|uniref:hypothetical protein n=1 Tax=Cryobacterium sp. 5B3 TaxID=3048586 RepID=UPI002B22B51D
ILDAERAAKSFALARSRMSNEVTMTTIAITANALPKIKTFSGLDLSPNSSWSGSVESIFEVRKMNTGNIYNSLNLFGY